MEGRRNYGAIDVKIVDRDDIGAGSMLAEAGPTSLNGIKPFSWSNTDTDIPVYNPVQTYNFSPVQTTWRDVTTLENPTTTSVTSTASTTIIDGSALKSSTTIISPLNNLIPLSLILLILEFY